VILTSHVGRERYNESGIISYVLLMLLIGTTGLVFLFDYREIFMGVSLVFAGIVAFKRKAISHKILYVMVIILVWLGITYIEYEVWNLTTTLGFYTRLLLGYFVVAAIGRNFFTLFENLVYKLTLIGLPFYVLGNLMPEAMIALHNLLGTFPSIFQTSDVVTGYQQQPVDSFLIYSFWIDRLDHNQGFMWESAAYAGVLLLAIFVRLTLDNYTGSMRLLVFVIALLTTKSATGYVASLVVFAYYLTNVNWNKRVMMGLFLVPVFATVLSVDYVYDKVVAETERGDYQTEGGGNSRLSSFIWDFRDFVEHPILGIGIFGDNRKTGYNQENSVNGVSDTFVRFGAIGAILFLMCYSFSCRKFCRSNHAKGWHLMLLLLLLINWSERFFTMPLFFAMQFYFLVNKDGGFVFLKEPLINLPSRAQSTN